MELVPCVLRILSVQQVISQMGMHVLGCFFFFICFLCFYTILKCISVARLCVHVR